MIEIIAGVWLTSFALSIPITALNVRYAYKLARSAKYAMLNQNLAKIGLYWSLSSESFKSVSEGSALKDEQSAARSYLFMGALGLLSAFGLLFLIILTLSLQFLVKNRLTRRVFHSALTSDTSLSAEEITKLVANLKANTY
jgi:hypothetical protein